MSVVRHWSKLVREAVVASGQPGWTFEQAGLVKGTPGHCRGVERR